MFYSRFSVYFVQITLRPSKYCIAILYFYKIELFILITIASIKQNISRLFENNAMNYFPVMSMLINFTTEDKPKSAPAAPSENKPVKRKRQKPPASTTGNVTQSGPGKLSNDGKEGEKGKSTHLSSSLFTSNPAIPSLEPDPKKTLNSEVLFEKSSFDTLDISSNIKGNLKTEFKCETMTKVQKLAIPAILSKRDVQV